MISSLSKVKDEAFAFLEYWATTEGLITEKLGLEGTIIQKMVALTP